MPWLSGQEMRLWGIRIDLSLCGSMCHRKLMSQLKKDDITVIIRSKKETEK